MGEKNSKSGEHSFSTHEYDSLRNEIIARIEAINSQSSSALASIIAAWASAIALLVLSFNEAIIGNTLILIGFDIAQSFVLFIPVIILLPLANKSGENITQITSISCYIRVFFENNYSESGRFSWEGANNSLSSVNMKRKKMSFGDFYNSEYSVLSIASIVMYIGFSILNYTRLISQGIYPSFLHFIHIVILLLSIGITVFTSVVASVEHSMRSVANKYLVGYLIHKNGGALNDEEIRKEYIRILSVPERHPKRGGSEANSPKDTGQDSFYQRVEGIINSELN